MQAIHNAAGCGHTELLTMLIDHHGVDPQEKADVRTIIIKAIMGTTCVIFY